ncbi:NAD(P)/FAD-dependent oxidoreductase [Cerasicoccus arenae]|uniref:NADH:ubiquinone reductase (non-electrogenic) n=1 Tax=Cerasicoccus arenae TaxID=424488 RepID=A0A8J3GCE1_9BACT|nr:NAD(P)/FAD-dependent oxidoreductase [Cerasicoccus arenae]MBK1857944.1 NAD(P)/FAD-dependent oxidoreductase [Cerasicoccus arenae]GHB97907.1 NADH dehydrogenase [Cerasicoccus arenae]
MKRILIIGGGFGGVAAAKELRGLPVEIGLVDRRNYHLFQPLLYQVATAALNPSDIASPIRKIFRHQKNVSVVLGTVEKIDLQQQRIFIEDQPIPYDYLVLAAGATHSYFGNEQWGKDAPGLKTIEDATEIRRRFLLAFESAEIETDPDARRASLTFVVVGAGPTGCELAGAMAEVARNTIPADFRHVDTATARVILIQGGPRVLEAFPEESSLSAQRQLEAIGVEIILNQRVTEVRSDGVMCGETFIAAHNVFWAAGVKASSIGETLGVPLDRSGRVKVNPDLSIPSYPNAFVIGDQAAAVDGKTGKPVPGVAQGALQGGSFVGKIIRRELKANEKEEQAPDRGVFNYFDKGNLATIGRNKAVAEIFGCKLAGFPAWVIWAVVHILFLVNFRSRLAVGFGWAWTYFFGDRGARLITGKSEVQIKRPPNFD